MPEALRRLIDWVAAYTVAPPGAVLRMAMSVADALYPSRAITGYALTQRGHAALVEARALTPARRRVLQALAEGPPSPAADLARRAGCGAGVVRALAESRPPRDSGAAEPGAARDAGLAPPGRARSPRRKRRRPRICRQGAGRRLLRDAARRRHRLGQDRGLFRRDRRGARARPAGAGAAAGDRAVGAMAGRASPTLRRRAGANGTPISAMPMRRDHLARRSPRARRRWWWARARRCSCRSPISASSSSTRSTRPPSSRRTASSITRATWRWCARSFCAAADRAGLGDALARDHGQCRAAAATAPASAGAARRGAAAGDPRHRHAPDAARAPALSGAAADRGARARRWRRASRRCCS